MRWMYTSTYGRRSGKAEIKAKIKALSWARRRVEELQEENKRLSYQHQLVAEMCKGFDWFRHVQLHARLADVELMLGDSASEQLTPGGMQEQPSNLLETEVEVQLLQQLLSLPTTQQNTSNGSAALPATLDSSGSLHAVGGSLSSNPPCPASNSQQIAPPGDSLWVLKQALQQPWPQNCPAADDVTVPDLIENFKATAHNLSLYLVQYDACADAAEQAGPLHNMQEVLLQHFRVVVELCGCSNRTHLIRSMQLTNCDTGEQLSELDADRIAWVIDRLQLSRQQQHNIAQGAVLVSRLLTPLVEELRELQLQQGGQCTAAVITDSCNKGADAVISGCQPGEGSAAAGAAEDRSSERAAAADGAGDTSDDDDAAYSLARKQSLLLQQQRSDRMRLLMAKDSFLRTWFASYLYGQLTWVQLARLHVLMFPFYPVPVIFYAQVAAKATPEQH